MWWFIIKLQYALAHSLTSYKATNKCLCTWYYTGCVLNEIHFRRDVFAFSRDHFMTLQLVWKIYSRCWSWLACYVFVAWAIHNSKLNLSSVRGRNISLLPSSVLSFSLNGWVITSMCSIPEWTKQFFLTWNTVWFTHN